MTGLFQTLGRLVKSDDQEFAKTQSLSSADDLREDRERLFALHGAIMSAYFARNASTIGLLLKEFWSRLEHHLMTERQRLHAMVQEIPEGERAGRRLRDCREEMERIEDSVLSLLQEYREAEPSMLLRCGFRSDLEYVGQILAERIQRHDALLSPEAATP